MAVSRKRKPVAVCSVAAVESLEPRAMLAATLTETALAQIRATGAQAFLAEIGGGSDREQVVAVLDTGLGARAIPAENRWINPGEIAGDGIDNDGNGFADDVSGWNFVFDTNDVTDTHGHGSRVASEIVLVDPRVKILALKVGTVSIGTDEAYRAMQYVESMVARGVAIVAANLSWGGGAYHAPSAVLIAGSSVLWVAAAGNYNTRLDGTASTFWPASYPGVVSVAATPTGSYTRATYSNYGAVTFAAPGAWNVTGHKGWASKLQGTSAAAPAVAGVISLAWRADDTATRGEVLAALHQSARPNSFTQFGMIDAESAARILFSGRAA